jgi:hypothetical protein
MKSSRFLVYFLGIPGKNALCAQECKLAESEESVEKSTSEEKEDVTLREEERRKTR